jgi:D-glycero-D-manno-heptose 1,7-bisphosphate phosphatase
MNRRRFVLLDRDGTLIVEQHYLSRVEDLQLLPASAEGLRQMQQLGLGLAVITNQSGIARGYFDRAAVDLLHDRLRQLLHEEGVRLEGIYVCPHGPDDGCPCRKPGTALVVQAAAELGFEPQQAFVIGDKASDVELGQRLGATTLLVRTGYGARCAQEGKVRPDFVTNDLAEAAQIIRGQLAVSGK